jgi:serine/threonine protein kinase
VRINVVPQTAHAGGVSAPLQASKIPGLQSEYEILSRIGGGGMGEVFLARDRHLGRHVRPLAQPQLLNQALQVGPLDAGVSRGL